MRNLFFCLFLLPFVLVAQQNLIPNPDFEKYYDCDYDVIATPLQDVIEDWSFRVKAPRYINSDCVDDPPTLAQSGQGFLLSVIDVDGPIALGYVSREYPQVELIQPIVAGKTYFLSYYMSSFLDSDISSISHHGIYFDNELVLSENVFGSNVYPLLLEPQIEIDTMMPLEVGTWRKITHCYVPDSNYNVMVVGVFADNDEIIKESISVEISYDNFFLTEIEPELRLSIENADTICAGECVTLSTNHSFIEEGDFIWDFDGADITSSTDPTVSVCYDTPGVYDVGIEVSHCAGAYTNFFPEAITVLGAIDYTPPWTDTLLCAGASVWVDLSNTPYQIEWSDDFEGDERFLEAGTYPFVLSINGACPQSYQFDIAYTDVTTQQYIDAQTCIGDPFELAGTSYTQTGQYIDTLYNAIGCDSIIYDIDFSHFDDMPITYEGIKGLCGGASSELQVVSEHQNIFWSFAEEIVHQGSIYTLDAAGRYTLTATDSFGCVYTDTLDISAYPLPEVMTEDLIDVFFENNMALPVDYNGQISTYNWSPAAPLDCGDCAFPTLLSPRNGVYQIEVINEYGCSDSDQIIVQLLENNYYLPNVIVNHPSVSTNGRFFLQSNADMVYDLEIYDRWGGLLFRANNLVANHEQQGWQPQGQVDPGVFVYLIRIIENGIPKILSGDVTVLE